MKLSFPSPRAVAALCFAIYLAGGLWIGALLPLGEGPDEPDHFAYVRTVAVERRLPRFSSSTGRASSMEACQPPAYYALGALLSAPWIGGEPLQLANNPNFDWHSPWPGYEPLSSHAWPWQGQTLAFRLLRLYSLALGMGTLWLVRRIAQSLFGAQSWCVAVAVAFVALNPRFIYQNAVVTNDALAAFSGSLLVWASLAVLERPGLRRFVFGGLALALAFLTKLTAALLAPGMVLAAAFAWKRIPGREERVKAIFALLMIPLAGAFWWYARNRLLCGDWTGMRAVVDTFEYYLSERLGKHIPGASEAAWNAFRSFWGRFGLGENLMSEPVYDLLLELHFAAFAGLLLAGARRLGRSGAQSRDSGLVQRIVVLSTGVACLLAGLSRFNAVAPVVVNTGRMLFPGLAIFAVAWTAGWRGILGEGRMRAFALAWTAAGLGLLLYVASRNLSPLYGPPQTMPPGFKPSYPLAARYGGALDLIGYDRPAKPGEGDRPTLYWRLAKPISEHFHARLEIPGTEGEGAQSFVSGLELRLPIYFWPVGEIVAEPFAFPEKSGAGEKEFSVKVMSGYVPLATVDPVDASSGALMTTPTLARTAGVP